MADPVQVAAKIAQKAVDALDPLAREMKIAKWPAEFQAIMWGAVAQHAGILAAEADAKHRASGQSAGLKEGE